MSGMKSESSFDIQRAWEHVYKKDDVLNILWQSFEHNTAPFTETLV